MELKNKIKEWCSNKNLNLDIFKEPVELYKEFGNQKSYHFFKGVVFELLLEELFIGNGYIVHPIGEGGSDGGCDLIIRYRNDNSIRLIIQAKNWKKKVDRYDVIKEFSKFQNNYLKQNDLKNSHFCLVAWDYVKGIKHILNSKLKINVWDEEDIVNNLIKTYNKYPSKKPNILLEPYQKDAYSKIIQHWESNKRCYVEHSTGTGKTYIIAKLVETLQISPGNKVLILSPSILINERIKKLLTRYIPMRDIASKYKENALVNLLTYQYLFHNSSNIPQDHFTHIIMDEAHRAGALEWHNKGLLKIISTKTKIVGLSATMQRYSYGIDIKKFLDNNCAGKLSLFEAMAAGIIPTGKYVYSVIDMKSKINEVKDEVISKYKSHLNKRDSLLNILDSKQIKGYSIQKIIYKHFSSKEYQKIIVFCETLEHAIDTTALLEKVFIKFSEVKIEKITSRGSKKDNKNLLDWFSGTTPNKNQIFILVAIDMLNEGIDVSGIDSVILFRKTESPRVYFQQIGRTLRKHGKDRPLIFDCVLNFQNVNIKLINEVQKEIGKYRKALNDFGFENIEVPKSFSITDETNDITNIIKKVEEKLNFYRSYSKASDAAQKLYITSEAIYRYKYREDPRLPSKPHFIYWNKGWIDWYDFLGTKKPDFYVSYSEAKNAAQLLRIKSTKEYKKRYKEDNKLPSQPDRNYKHNGWTNWNDFLNKNNFPNYPTYQEAKIAVQILGIKSYSSYKNNHNKDPRLPHNPKETYKNKGWINFEDFFGVSTVKIYPTYHEAKKAVAKLKINSEKEYRIRRKEDKQLPASPDRYYKRKGWIDFYDFFNKDRTEIYSTYNEAKKAVRKLSIKSRREYDKRYKEDSNLPSNPEDVYKGEGWTNYYDFLGVEKTTYYRTYNKAKKAVMELGIMSRREYIEGQRYKEDSKLPSNPSKYYKNKGWVKWAHFITNCYSYDEAKRAVKKLGISKQSEYLKRKRYKEDPFLPSDPPKRYKNNGWIDWYHFLDKDRPIAHYTYLEAKKVVRNLEIKSIEEYKRIAIHNPKFPRNPSEFYKNKGWTTSSDFLGLSKPSYYKTYKEAKHAAQHLGIKNRHHYIDKKRYKEDPKLPSAPDKYYKSKGWEDWYSFLGNQHVSIYPTLEEAKKAVKRLGIKSGTEYKKYRMYKKDPRLPSSPDKTYKNKGWISFYDFFGTEDAKHYSTFEEAKSAVRKLGIKTVREYRFLKRYKDDPMLTSSPNRTYKNKGWTSWDDFLG